MGPTLPPRDPPVTEPDGGDDNDTDRDDRLLLAYIELQVSSPPAGMWSVAQWQDSSGNWQDVEGWRSVLDWGGFQRWTVEARNFGTGLFRWQVRQDGPNGPVLGTSKSFGLPTGANQTMQIQVTL